MGFVANLFSTYPRGTDPVMTGPGAARVVTAMLLALASFLLWREFEPVVLFLPTTGVVLGTDVSKVTLYVKRTSYVAGVDYRYRVHGQGYLGTQYRRTPFAHSRWGAARFANLCAAGTRVQVWYNPLNPADAVLRREPHPGILLIFVLSALIAGWIWLKYSRPPDEWGRGGRDSADRG